MTRLAVGISGSGSYLPTVLGQLGIPFETVPDIGAGWRSGVRVFIWDGPIPSSFPSCDGPGAVVITCHRHLGSWTGKSISAARSFVFEIGSESFYCKWPLNTISLPSSGKCRDEKGDSIPGSGVVRYRIGGLEVLSLPWDFFSIRFGQEWGYRPYYSVAADKHFVEVGPMMDFGALRRLLLLLLIEAFSNHRLPLLRLSSLPVEGRSFCVRIDADGYSPASTDSVLRLAREISARFTWYVSVQDWRKAPNGIRRLLEAGQEVQLHCYRHMTYRSRRVNYANLRKGKAILNRMGVNVTSAVSPLGYHFQGFSEALRRLRIRHSSEFGYSVDDLPSFPDGDTTAPLQVPVHCGSIGCMGRSGFSRQEVMEHLREYIPRRIRQEGVALVYDHPLGRMERFESELAATFRQFRDEGIRYLNMSDYASAWRRRQSFRPVLQNDVVVVNEAGPNRDFVYESYGPPCRYVGASSLVKWQRETPPLYTSFRMPDRGTLESLGACRIHQSAYQNILEWYLDIVMGSIKARTRQYYRDLTRLVCQTNRSNSPGE